MGAPRGSLWGLGTGMGGASLFMYASYFLILNLCLYHLFRNYSKNVKEETMPSTMGRWGQQTGIRVWLRLDFISPLGDDSARI